ncbi:response regulator [Phycicoccus avicenniae]|uniref:response regulator n=1 Tax=Phycicoccus avicenniae TaxID=2828860 RepID=UPI003D29038B
MKLLVVDDSRVMRQIVTRTLRQAGHGGHDIVEADNGRSGLEAVAAHRPDLVLSDWNMPEMSGLEFLEALRASGDGTPFGFVTSEGSVTMRSQALAAGALFLVGKPFTAESFALHLDPVLGRGGHAPAVAAVEDRVLGHNGLPERKETRDLLERLLGRDCVVTDALGYPTPADGRTTSGEIVDDEGRVTALLVADHELVVRAGACLSLTPAGAAEDLVKDGETTPPVRAAFSEVLNVFTSLFNGGGGTHVRLGRVWFPPEAPPADVLGTVDGSLTRDDLAVSVAGYGEGRFSVVLPATVAASGAA